MSHPRLLEKNKSQDGLWFQKLIKVFLLVAYMDLISGLQ